MVLTDLQQLPVPWTEIQPVLQILSHYHLEDYIPSVLRVIYHPELKYIQTRNGVFHLTCYQLATWAQEWLPESFFALSNPTEQELNVGSVQQEGKHRKDIFIRFIEDECISGEVLIHLLRHYYKYNLLPISTKADQKQQTYPTSTSSLQSTSSEVSQGLKQEGNDVDGMMQNEVDDQLAPSLQQLSDNNDENKESLPLSYLTVILLQLIFNTWSMCIKHSYDFSLSDIPLTVHTGHVTDLTGLPPAIATTLVDIDRQAAATGEGYYYGQLLVLGYTEYRQVDKKWIPFGLANQKFALKRRKLANGLKLAETYVKHTSGKFKHVAFYVKNTSKDDENDVVFVPPNLMRSVRHLQPHNLVLQFGPVDDVGNVVSTEEVEAMRSHSEDDFNTPSPMKDDVKDSDDDSDDAAVGAEQQPARPSPTPTFTLMPNEVVLEYQSDPVYDMFQLGRAVNSTNDFIIPGQLHLSDDGNYTSPVSRWACRIVCERLPPYRSFIYAGGFNDMHNLKVKGMDYDGEYDGFTTYGVRIYQPESQEWLEVSVMGNVFEPRLVISEIPTYPDIRKTTRLGNQLTNGTLIDFCGVYLVFQDPVTMAKQIQTVNPKEVIDRLNAQKPQCPVLMTEITFAYHDAKERVQRAIEKLDQDVDLTQSYGRYRPIHIPIVDYSEVNEENRSYVFPSCGHVHGYHKSLEHHACPLCRTYGSFVPIAFAFESSLNSLPANTSLANEADDNHGPTHVFNPCGHVASFATCAYWSKLQVFCKQFYTPAQFIPRTNTNNAADQHGNPFDPIDFHAICPFCCTELNPRKPFSRLILQAEQGFGWGKNNQEQQETSLSNLPSPLVDEESPSWEDEQFRQMFYASQRVLFQREFGGSCPQLAGNDEISLFRPLHFPTLSRNDSMH